MAQRYTKRLQKELQTIQTEAPPGITVQDASNLGRLPLSTTIFLLNTKSLNEFSDGQFKLKEQKGHFIRERDSYYNSLFQMLIQ